MPARRALHSSMEPDMNEVAEIEAVSIVNSFDETTPRTQTAVAFDLQAEEPAPSSQPAASSKWTAVWQTLSNGQYRVLLI